MWCYHAESCNEICYLKYKNIYTCIFIKFERIIKRKKSGSKEINIIIILN